MKHNYWLDWKIKNGLAQRGRTESGWKPKPKSFLGKLAKPFLRKKRV